MAEKEATLVVRLKDMMSTSIGGLLGKLKSLNSAYLAAGAAVAGLTSFLKASLQAYMEQETANNKLNLALKNQGVYTTAVEKDLQAYSASLQKTTTFTDENITTQMALLTTFGLTGDQLKQTTKAALDLSVGLGIDLRSATMLMGKAFAGETGALSRYGIIIDEGIPKTERFAEVMGQVNQRFGGQAVGQIKTAAGQIENLSNRMAELKERIGEQLIPALKFWANALEKVVGWMEKLGVSTEDDLRGRELTIAALREEMTALIEKSTLEGTYNEETIQRRLQNYEDAIMREQGLLENEQKVEQQRQQKALAAVQREKKFQADIAAERTKAEAKEKTRAEKESNETRERHNKLTNDILAFQDKVRANQEATNRQRSADMQSTLSFISTLTESKHKEMVAIGKAAAIANATMDTWAGATKALNATPWPPVNIALMAAVIAAGMSNVARIAGVRMAEGGVVLPREGGTQAILGEAGQAEAVIPLDEAGMGGGVGLTVNINAGVVVADRMSVQEFARQIDEELWRMSVNRRSVAF